jgi:TolA-binding protein
MMRDAALGFGVLFSLVALVLALRGGDPAVPAPTNGAPPSNAELRGLQNTVERQARRISQLEANLGDLQDTVSALRDRTPPAGLPGAKTPPTAPAAEPPPAAAQAHAAGLDAGMDVVMRELVATAVKEEREKQFQQFRERMVARHVERLDADLSLTEEQRAQLLTLLKDVEARREEAANRASSGVDPRAARREASNEVRSYYDGRMKELLTPKQLETWGTMDERQRQPPRGGPPPGFGP